MHMNNHMSSRCALFALCLCAMLFSLHANAQIVQVKGTVSASGASVRDASVSFEEKDSPANSYSALTDSLGRYQFDIVLTSVKPRTDLPAKFALEQNYPNPFSTSTVVPFELKEQSNVQVTIYDILGRVVRRIAAGSQSLGQHSVLWDGRNSLGKRVANGIYFYSLDAGGASQAKKMVLNGTGGVGSIALPHEQTPTLSYLDKGMDLEAVGKTFAVRIENTLTTSPLIITTQIEDVAVRSDTTIDIPVAPLSISTVFLDSVQQYIRGFGAANILPWRPDMTAGQVQTAFGSGPGQLGFTILRLRIPYTDDVSEFSAQVPTAKLAQSLGAIVFASPWTPPPSMKTSNNIVGGSLIADSLAVYAAHLKAFADYMASNDVPLYAVSLQNEPDANVTYESCSWNATQFLNFVKNNAPSVGTRIMMPESQNFVHQLSDSTLNDPAAVTHVDIIAGHIYGGGLAPYPLAVSMGKEVWMTEHLVLDTTWAAVLGTGREIHDCMIAGMNAYVWWYLVRFYGPLGEDGIVTRRGYVMSQFARFIRPGFHRVKGNATPQRNVYVSSYADSATARVVIVALNTNTSPIQQGFEVSNGSMTSFAKYTTSQSKNCVQGPDVPAADGRVAATLEASSITTFVSK
jgi:glucuronoarabinoxylan endo-1,4-beta-xylanase